jgi:hypothetical protein
MLLQRPYLTKGDVENDKREMNNDVSLAAYPSTAFIREIYCSLSGQLTVETYMVKSESSIVSPASYHEYDDTRFKHKSTRDRET